MRRPSVARYVWALPNTLLGLLFAPAAMLGGGGMRVVGGVLEIHGPAIAALLRLAVLVPGGASAMTLGHVVLGRSRKALDATRSHERVHVRQCETWGPAFIPAYLLAGLWGGVTGRGGYHGNWFERQALAQTAGPTRRLPRTRPASSPGSADARTGRQPRRRFRS